LAAEPSKRDWLVALVDRILETGQADVIDATECILRSNLNAGVALQYIRMHPQFAAEGIEAFLRNPILRPEDGNTQ
jgi:hypothetical protein